MVPMWSAFLVFGLVLSVGNTFYALQGINLESADVLLIYLFLLRTIAREMVSNDLSPLCLLLKWFPEAKLKRNMMKIWVGMVISILCSAVAWQVEVCRLDIFKYEYRYWMDSIPMSIWWLAPQFFLLGLMEGLAMDGLNEFTIDDDNLSISMKKFLLAINNFVVTGIGSALNILYIYSNMKLFLYTLNESRLDLYYKYLTIYGTPLNCVYLLLISILIYRDKDAAQSLVTYGKAVQAAVMIGDLKRAREVVDLMKKRGVRPNVFIYNVLMGVLCKEKKTRDAEKLFDEMCKRNLVPTRVTYNTLIDGSCKAVELEKAFGLRERMKIENVEANLVTFNSLLSGLCKAKRMEEAKKVCQEMEANGFVPDGFIYSILFDGFSRSGDCEGVIALYKEAIVKGARINSYTCSILLNVLCKQGKIEKAEEILGKEMENGHVPNVVMFNTIMNGYCRREIDKAEKWVKKIAEKGISPNLETHNTLINGYGRMDLFDRCFQILEEMEYLGMKPNVEAEIVLKDMEDRGVSHNTQIYNMLIDGTCSVGRIKDAFKFFDEMVESKIAPTLVTYNVLINGLCKKASIMEAEDLLNQIISTAKKQIKNLSSSSQETNPKFKSLISSTHNHQHRSIQTQPTIDLPRCPQPPPSPREKKKRRSTVTHHQIDLPHRRQPLPPREKEKRRLTAEEIDPPPNRSSLLLPTVAAKREGEEEIDGRTRWFGWLRSPRLGPRGGVNGGDLGFVFGTVNLMGFVRFVDLCLKLLNDFLDRGFVRLFLPFILFLELIEEDEICGFYFVISFWN
ncbi:hypothetical protein LWI29_024882 [Acer saccharum]|uniref:Pentatricopeptide repeat-containing protein n=1 Tax=Acer saccharum TaxID=4024 RepID=A0AA39SLN3_ACESA|nr:hypothetical protein LWI29_024882 [Acer saccharum]